MLRRLRESTRPKAGSPGREGRVIEGLRDAAAAEHADAHAMPVSELVCDIARGWPTERLTLGELIALPNLLPVPIPGLGPIPGSVGRTRVAALNWLIGMP